MTILYPQLSLTSVGSPELPSLVLGLLFFEGDNILSYAGTPTGLAKRSSVSKIQARALYIQVCVITRSQRGGGGGGYSNIFIHIYRIGSFFGSKF